MREGGERVRGEGEREELLEWPLSCWKLQHRIQVRGDWRDEIGNLRLSHLSPDLVSHVHKFGIFLRAVGNH